MFNETLREARIRTGLSQRKFAKSIGLSPDLYNKYEQGVSRPSLDTLVLIVEALPVSADFLLGLETVDDPTPISDFNVCPEEYEVIKLYRKLHPDKQRAIVALME